MSSTARELHTVSDSWTRDSPQLPTFIPESPPQFPTSAPTPPHGLPLAAQTSGGDAHGVLERDLIARVRRDVAERLQAGELPSSAVMGRGGQAGEVRGGEPAHAAAWQLIADVLDQIAGAALRDGEVMASAETEVRVARAVFDSLFGLGGFTPLLADPQVENVDANGCDQVWVRYADGTQAQVGPVADSDDDMVDLIRMLAARSGVQERRFDRGAPALSLQLPDGSRMFALMSVSQRPSVSIRRHRYLTTTLDELQQLGTVDAGLRELLTALVLARKNVLVAGGTNLGKTTVLRALAAAIPAHERLITIEDAYELGLHHDRTAHPNVVPLQAREANIEGQGEVTQSDLVRYALRMAPDRVIVGEIRGSEVIPMCNAMSQGNDGSMATIHASTSRAVFTRLAAYAYQSPERLPLEATNLLVASAVDVIVHLRWAQGMRVVSSIREVVDAEGPMVISNEIYRPDATGRAVPGVPLRPETLDALIGVGFDERILERRDGWWPR